MGIKYYHIHRNRRESQPRFFSTLWRDFNSLLSETESDQGNILASRSMLASHGNMNLWSSFHSRFDFNCILKQNGIFSIWFHLNWEPEGGKNFKYKYKDSHKINTRHRLIKFLHRGVECHILTISWKNMCKN